MKKKKRNLEPQKNAGKKLGLQLDNPTQKIHWALRLLRDKGYSISQTVETPGRATCYKVGDQTLSAQQVYALVTKYPEWNDRLGLGTARLPKIRP